MKKLLLFALSAMLLATACLGCASQQAAVSTDEVQSSTRLNVDTTNQSVTMKVTSIDGNSITAEIGSLSTAGQPGGAQPGGMQPGGEMGSFNPNDSSSNSTDSGVQDDQNRPEPPEGDQAGATPPGGFGGFGGQQGGDMNGNGTTPPPKPEDNSDNTSGGIGNDAAPEIPGEESSQNSDSANPNGGAEMPSDMGFNSPFTSSGLSVTFTVSDTATITKNSEAASLSDIAVDSILTVTFGESDSVVSIDIYEQQQPQQGQPMDMGNSGNSQDNGSAATELTEDSTLTGETYTSEGADENALRVTGATVTMDSVTINKASGETSNSENGDFYGTNAAFLAQDGANVTISNATVSSSAQNGNGIFSYGEGTVVTVSDSNITTTKDNSGGIHVTGGATLNASNLTVVTNGNSSAAIRSDRGGGNMTVDSGSYTSNGTGSPAIYSVANIYVSNSTLNATNSEALVIEGKNSISLSNCDVTGNMVGTYKDEEENIHNIMIYQSMSGDADIGQSSFSAEGGSITAKQGDMFYVTNTSCTVSLNNVALTLANDTLFRIEGNNSSRGWGQAGSNGGTCVFTAKNQKLEGNIIVDEISELTMTLSEGSSFTGAINVSGNAGTVNVTLDDSSIWKLTGNSYVTSLSCNADQIDLNGYTLYVNGEAYYK